MHFGRTRRGIFELRRCNEESLPSIAVGTIAANDAAQTRLDARLISTNCTIGLLLSGRSLISRSKPSGFHTGFTLKLTIAFESLINDERNYM